MAFNTKEKQREYHKRWYKKNKEKRYASIKKWQKEARKKIQKIKESNPCMDCGQKYPYYVMDYDHREGEEKEFTVAHYTGKAWQRVLNEIAKCDLVCSNCHRIRTCTRMGL